MVYVDSGVVNVSCHKQLMNERTTVDRFDAPLVTAYKAGDGWVGDLYTSIN